jgi:hypothetical protein
MTSVVEKAIRALLPSVLPPSLSQNAGNLYQVLSRTPANSAGKKVYQTRWRAKDIKGCYWLVKRTQFKCEGKHGKAWGKLYWKGESDLRLSIIFNNERARCALHASHRKTRQPEGREGTGRTKI